MPRHREKDQPTRCGLIIVLLALTSCITDVWSLPDVRFQSVTVVDLANQADIRSLSAPHWRHKQVLEVFLRSDTTDLYRFADRTGFTMGKEASFCSGNRFNHLKPLSGLSLVVGEQGPVKLHQNPMPPDRQIGTFHVYIDMNHPAECQDTDCPIPPYDLLRRPKDVCFYLRGGTMIGTSFRSNTVVVPKSAIEAALRDAHLTQ